MYNKFVRTSNVLNFLAGFTALETRGAAESCYMLVSGRAGYGKTGTARWWANKPEVNGVYIQAAAGITPHWILAEIVRELGDVPDRRREYCFGQALRKVALARRPIVIDEAEFCLNDPEVLESVRGISDLTEVPVVLVGYDKIMSKLAPYEQLYSRISAIVSFNPLEVVDVRACCTELAEVTIHDDLVEEIHRQSAGRLRLIKEGIGNAERHAKRNKLAEVSLDDMRGQVIINNWSKTGKGRS
ncbi:DNA segregation ATPase [Geotalea uraniireducens]|uniref:DNA segregation ATPase n=1 Tax=Geotalea uraniireducens TaxID=351604 RepID=A0ABM8EJ57_9BACT|nr:ATP-binding protein [Geotalea uraniireducens]BDV42407.1 DNA segregation ATPase [Geotalea uraniireducens]